MHDLNMEREDAMTFSIRSVCGKTLLLMDSAKLAEYISPGLVGKVLAKVEEIKKNIYKPEKYYCEPDAITELDELIGVNSIKPIGIEEWFKTCCRRKDLYDKISEVYAELSADRSLTKSPKLSYDEAFALVAYCYEAEPQSDSPYRVLNKTLGTRKAELLSLQKYFAFYILSALRKLPEEKDVKVLYRGINAGSIKLDNYVPNKRMTWLGFSSTTTSEPMAARFANGEGGGVIFEIHGNFKGRSIRKFSFMEREGEILLEPETKIEVCEVRVHPSYYKTIKIVVNVIESKPPLEKVLKAFKEILEANNVGVEPSEKKAKLF